MKTRGSVNKHNLLAMAEQEITISTRAKRIRISTALVVAITVIVAGVAASAAHAQQTVSVFVPGNTNGDFGNPVDTSVPMVSAFTVTTAGTITVTYDSGTVTDSGGVNTGPNGVKANLGSGQTPLEESLGIAGGTVSNLDALIGVFVPAFTVNKSGFSPIDATKGTTHVGITPCHLFFIGTGKSFKVSGAGTLFLGINDFIVGDNGGGFDVDVSGP